MSSSVVFQAGDTAMLPCDISVPPNSGNGNNDELTLVMWYREDVGSPIYSIGNVGNAASNPRPSILRPQFES